MSDLKAFKAWFETSGYGEMERMRDIYNYEPQDLMLESYIKGLSDGCVSERSRIVERIKDNLTPSVAETVISIIYAA